jgi:hypothetical protein
LEEEEVAEIRKDLEAGNPQVEEFGDALAVLFDTAGRCGFTPEQVIEAHRSKFESNKKSEWKLNSNGSYSRIK